MVCQRLPRILLLIAGLLCTPALSQTAPCANSVTAKPGDTCITIASTYGISVAQFIQINPSMTNCRLTAGATYCVRVGTGSTAAPSTPSAPSSAPTGTLVPSPDGSEGVCGGNYTCLGSPYGVCCSESGYCGDTTEYCGEGCQPAYGNCGGGACPVCEPAGAETVTITAVSTKTVVSTSTVTKTVTATPTAAITPTPILKGTVKNCTKYYLVKATDTCPGIARSNGITQTLLYSWNPNFDCEDMEWLSGYYVCVAIK